MRICHRLEVPLSHFRLYIAGIRKNFMLVWMLQHLHCVVVVQQRLHVLLPIRSLVLVLSLMCTIGFFFHLGLSKLRIREID